MNNTKHTPGPWTVRYAKNITAIGTTKGEMQLSLHGVYDGLKPLSVDVHEWQANANLIAAAPAMYEALKRIKVLMESGDIEGRDWVEYGHIINALAQAEGR